MVSHSHVHDIERFHYAEIQDMTAPLVLGHNPTASVCEACDQHLARHMWADLDVNGVAVNCSVLEWKSLHKDGMIGPRDPDLDL